jgi:hypothetical protein
MTDACLTPEQITQLAQHSAQVRQRCKCAGRTFDGWESLPMTFPEELLECVGKISPPSESELTVVEYHPGGTNYWSPDAPIALNYFPANRSEIWRCGRCARCFLRYTEFGGYYLDRRIRSLRPELLSFASPQPPSQ